MTIRSMYVYNGATWDEVGFTVAHDVPAGGASGTLLSKASATDYDTSWIAQSALTIAPSQVTGTAIVSTLADAKGDLLVGTAADTVGRLAAGSNGARLTADSSTSSGLRWTSARLIPPVGGTSTLLPHNGISTLTASTSQGLLSIYAVEIPVPMTVSDVSIYVNVAAAAGAVWRLGFWQLDGTGGLPSTLIADLGTVDPTGTGQKTISSLSTVLPAGMVGFGYALQGSGAGGGNAAAGLNQVGVFGSTLNDPRIFCWQKSAETGAFGATLGTASVANTGLSLNASYKRSA